MKPELWPEFLFHASIARLQTEYSLQSGPKASSPSRQPPGKQLNAQPTPAHSTTPPEKWQLYPLFLSGDISFCHLWALLLFPLLPPWDPHAHTSLRPSLPLLYTCAIAIHLRLFPALTFWSISWHLSIWKFTRFQRQPCVSRFLPSFWHFLEDTMLHRVTY